METTTFWKNFSNIYYFFILKKVGDKDNAQEILQNAFLKIHQKLSQLKDDKKAEAWGFQIVRNEINLYFRQNKKTSNHYNFQNLSNPESIEKVCCFDRFLEELPENYKEVVELVFIKGYKQVEAAKIAQISLANVKARIRRTKDILRERFENCCQFEVNENGKLIGQPNCAHCE